MKISAARHIVWQRKNSHVTEEQAEAARILDDINNVEPLGIWCDIPDIIAAATVAFAAIRIGQLAVAVYGGYCVWLGIHQHRRIAEYLKMSANDVPANAQDPAVQKVMHYLTILLTVGTFATLTCVMLWLGSFSPFAFRSVGVYLVVTQTAKTIRRMRLRPRIAAILADSHNEPWYPRWVAETDQRRAAAVEFSQTV